MLVLYLNPQGPRDSSASASRIICSNGLHWHAVSSDLGSGDDDSCQSDIDPSLGGRLPFARISDVVSYPQVIRERLRRLSRR